MYIRGVDSNWVFASDNTRITDVAGRIHWEKDDTGNIKYVQVYYDVTLCGDGEGYIVVDSTGACIENPRPVILFHELAHVDIGPEGPNLSHEEAQRRAIEIENQYRQSLGLHLRDTIIDSGACWLNSLNNGYCIGENPNKSVPPNAGPAR